MSGSLVQFMKTGNPNGGGLPEWAKYSAINGETMILDDVSEMKNDADREARKVIIDLICSQICSCPACPRCTFSDVQVKHYPDVFFNFL